MAEVMDAIMMIMLTSRLARPASRALGSPGAVHPCRLAGHMMHATRRTRWRISANLRGGSDMRSLKFRKN